MARRLDVIISADARQFYFALGRFQGYSNAAVSVLRTVGTTAASVVSKVAEFADKIDELSAKTGLSTDYLQKLSYVSDQSGMDITALAESASKLQKILGDSTPTAEATSAARKLGLSWHQLKAMSPDKQFSAVLGALSKVGNQSQRTYIATALLGKGGAEALKALAGGAGGLEAAFARAEKLNLIMTPERIKAAAAFNDRMGETKAVLLGLGAAVTGAGFEQMDKALASLNESIAALGKNKDVQQIGAAMGVMSEALGSLLSDPASVSAVSGAIGDMAKNLSAVFADPATREGIKLLADVLGAGSKLAGGAFSLGKKAFESMPGAKLGGAIAGSDLRTLPANAVGAMSPIGGDWLARRMVAVQEETLNFLKGATR